MTMRLSIIAAVASNGVIGQDGDMPWKLSTDLKRFKALTTGKPVIMGRRTFVSIGRPLPNRVNIVLTRDKAFGPQGVVTVPTLDAALAAAIAAGAAAEVGTEAEAETEAETEAMVIGGGEIYRAFLDRADRLYITHVDAEPAGDTHFPAIDPAVWEIVSSEAVPAGASDTAATRFTIYQRRRG